MNRNRNPRVTVQAAVQELDLKSAAVGIIADGAQVAGGNGNSVHGDASLVERGKRANSVYTDTGGAA